MNYTKPALSLEDQADLLLRRGLVGDRDLMIDRLGVVSYYRLSGYWYTFRVRDPNDSKILRDDFKQGTTFGEVWNRYVFDRHLRLAAMDAIERIEIAVRTALAYQHAHAHGPFAYATDPSSLSGLDKSNRLRFLSSILNEMSRSKDIFIKHFDDKYGGSHYHLPIWMAVEIMSFGSVLSFYRGCSPGIRQAVAKPFGVDDTVLESWLLMFNMVRNICAHHGRLWNRQLGVKPKIPKKNPDWHTPVLVGNDRMFGVLTICKWSLDRIASQSRWSERLSALLANYPDVPVVNMGFPTNWEESVIWSKPATPTTQPALKGSQS